MPVSVRIAFRSFSDIQVAGSYTAPDRSQLPTSGAVPLSDVPQFNFTERWNIEAGERIRCPFDIWDELVPKLLHALKKVCACFYLLVLE